MNHELAYRHAAGIAACLGEPGRMITWSKGDYQDRHPTHVVVFNGNVCFGGEKVWFGDVDLTLGESMLVNLAAETGETVYLLRERDGRFANEDEPLLERAVYSVYPVGETRFDCAQLERRRRDGALILRRPVTPPGGRTGADEEGQP